MRRLLQGLARSVLRMRSGGPKAHRIPFHWIRRPLIEPGDLVCLFVAFPRKGRLLPHTIDHIAAWRAAGYKTIVIVAAESLNDAIDLSMLDAAGGLALRVNQGYDFGGWAAAIRALDKPLLNAAVLALANDSLLGPSASFRAMLDKVERSQADVIGLVENRQVRRHFQSFVLFFKGRSLQTEVFCEFWHGVRSGGRDYVIEFYETTLLATFAKAGLRLHTLFPTADDTHSNPTLTSWEQLIDDGFPYIKIQLFRDNPSKVGLGNWQVIAGRGGFDVARLERQIAALKQHGGERWQV